jgi:hypothetical protein
MQRDPSTAVQALVKPAYGRGAAVATAYCSRDRTEVCYPVAGPTHARRRDGERRDFPA